jgi:tRNA(Ile)-lysidine synthase
VVALVLDHRARAAAATEAALAAAWLGARGIPVRRLALPPDLPRDAEALRQARLAALAEAAAEDGCLHLLLAQHCADQAETVLIRALRGSHRAGLAAMAPARPFGTVRLVRPLLGAAPGALRAVLRAAGQPWIEDPSNAGGSVRARLRAALADRAGEGRGVIALAAAAEAARRTRASAEETRDRALAEAVTLAPQGCAWIDPARAGAVDAAMLAALLRTIGGHAQPVRAARAGGLLARLHAGEAGVAAGCLLRRTARGWLLGREPAAVAASARVPASGRLRWDGRWHVEAPAGLSVGALGAEAAALARAHPPAAALPRVVLATLPALRAGPVLVAVPPIGYHSGRLQGTIRAVFRPPQPATASTTLRVAASGGSALASEGAVPT